MFDKWVAEMNCHELILLNEDVLASGQEDQVVTQIGRLEQVLLLSCLRA